MTLDQGEKYDAGIVKKTELAPTSRVRNNLSSGLDVSGRARRVVGACALCFSIPLFEEGHADARRTYDGILIVPRVVYEDSSQVQREGKSFSVLFGATLTGRKLQMEAFTNPNNLTFYAAEYQRTPNHLVAHTVGWKRFLDNSFYVSGGLFYRITDFAQGRQRGTGVTASIGNVWQYENLSIGGEWLQVFQTLVVHEGVNRLRLTPFTFRFLVGAAF